MDIKRETPTSKPIQQVVFGEEQYVECLPSKEYDWGIGLSLNIDDGTIFCTEASYGYEDTVKGVINGGIQNTVELPDCDSTLPVNPPTLNNALVLISVPVTVNALPAYETCILLAVYVPVTLTQINPLTSAYPQPSKYTFNPYLPLLTLTLLITIALPL